MRIVVDTNIIFSSLLAKSSELRDILIESNNQYYSPNFVFVELYKHKEKIQKYCKLSDIELYEYLNGILEKIHFITTDLISTESKQKAYNFCIDIDLKDTPFLALAIEIKAKLWTGDEKLKKELRKKGYDAFFEIEEDK